MCKLTRVLLAAVALCACSSPARAEIQLSVESTARDPVHASFILPAGQDTLNLTFYSQHAFTLTGAQPFQIVPVTMTISLFHNGTVIQLDMSEPIGNMPSAVQADEMGDWRRGYALQVLNRPVAEGEHSVGAQTDFSQFAQAGVSDPDSHLFWVVRQP